MKKLEALLAILLVLCCAYLAYGLWKEPSVPDAGEVQTEASTTAVTQEDGTAEDDALPARYDSREAGRGPTVKNQGSLGTCWAVAASLALEAALLPQERIVFSADHISLQNHFSRDQNDGGDYTMAMAYLAGWQGPVREEDDPYGDGVSDAELAPVCHVQEMQTMKERDDEAIKRAVHSYGAVQSSIYMDIQNAFGSSAYYNQLEASYLYAGEEGANHDILIIGWDDTYPASNFNYNASRDGAFICQNSWGEEFGENGIFYVSYEDANIAANSIAYTVIESADNYDHLYQSDLCGYVGQVGYGDGTAYFANVYQSAGNEDLEAVGFYATGKDTEYTVSVVENFSDTAQLAAGKRLASGSFTQSGYYTAHLSQPVELAAGERYAVVMWINTPDALYPVAAEYAADEATQDVELSDGEGYISHKGIVWTRAEEEYSCNLCLKAYTKDRQEG